MFAAFEEIAKKYEHVISAIGVIGTILAAFATVAAVGVSLHLARRNERVRLKASLGIGIRTDTSVQCAIIKIINIGVRPTSLPALFFEWRIPFTKREQPETMMNWINAAYSIRDQPREIAAGRTTEIYLLEADPKIG
jgi:hypothetical protein